MSVLDDAAANVARWRDDERGILQFVEEQFKATPDSWQEEGLLAIRSTKPEDQRVSFQACAGPGKTAVLAWAGWWFLAVQGDRDEHPQGACVSITRDNLRDNLWKEYAKWQNRSEYLKRGFTHSAHRISSVDFPETWFLSARSWPKSANADEQGATLSGLHSKYVLVEADESGAIPTPIMRAAEQAMAQASGGFAKLVQAGNPISLEGMLYAAAKTLRHLWRIIRVTGDPNDPKAWVHNARVGPGPKKWAQQQIDAYGRDNPWVMSYILGSFPPASINALLGDDEVDAAMKRVLKGDVYDWAQKRIGVDPARFGDDRTVLFPRQGLYAGPPVVIRNADNVEIATKVAVGMDKWMKDGDGMVFVDDTGPWGKGSIDLLHAWGRSAHGVQFHGRALDARYENRRAEMWIQMANWVKGQGRLPRIEELVAELTTPTYTFSKNGKFLIEDKDLIKQRLGRSPDLADALALTFALPEMPREAMQRHARTRSTIHDYDPFAKTIRDEQEQQTDFEWNPFTR